ncbi:Presenilin enhancer-2 subunit of gamma secretase-domain-containing protein [Phycomyces nitens]|nr:Presenilin enhancer-2 subunit of gamma secretase-domain-containing protein [Phycomyces nitens]
MITNEISWLGQRVYSSPLLFYKMPRLDKMSNDELVNISKKMFYGGFALLPFLWLVNVMYFFTICRKPTSPPALRKYVIMSLTGCLVCFVGLTTWYALFVNKRVQWGQAADTITVVIPKGV